VVGSFGDTYRVPVGFAAVVTPARILDVGAAFTFPNLAGRSDALRPRSDERVVQAFVSFRTGGSSSPAAVAAPVAPVASRIASAPAAAPCPVAAVTSAAPAPAPTPQVVPEAATVAPVAREAATAEVIPDAAPGPAAALEVVAAPAAPTAVVAAPAAVATPEVVTAQPATFTITIADFAFAPSSIDVSPGATIRVVNGDSVPHSVTSERAPGEFAPGAVGGVSFDTGPFVGERSFAIPADAVPGTVIPFYCSVHRERMRTPDGAVRIVAAQ
jgi:plastocyanin